jgi:hypothetical protein
MYANIDPAPAGQAGTGIGEAPLFNWRKHLPVHPLAEAYPNLPHERLVAFGGDIKNKGLQFPIVVHAKGNPGNPDVFELAAAMRCSRPRSRRRSASTTRQHPNLPGIGRRRIKHAALNNGGPYGQNFRR